MEHWNGGMMGQRIEDENHEILILPSSLLSKPNIPVFHHSIIPDGVVTTIL